jgi:hypothetical protein
MNEFNVDIEKMAMSEKTRSRTIHHSHTHTYIQSNWLIFFSQLNWFQIGLYMQFLF